MLFPFSSQFIFLIVHLDSSRVQFCWRSALRPLALTPSPTFATLELAANLAYRQMQGPCRSGGIGRRAWFRSMYSQGCGGSSPLFGTKDLGNTQRPGYPGLY